MARTRSLERYLDISYYAFHLLDHIKMCEVNLQSSKSRYFIKQNQELHWTTHLDSYTLFQNLMKSQYYSCGHGIHKKVDEAWLSHTRWWRVLLLCRRDAFFPPTFFAVKLRVVKYFFNTVPEHCNPNIYLCAAHLMENSLFSVAFVRGLGKINHGFVTDYCLYYLSFTTNIMIK